MKNPLAIATLICAIAIPAAAQTSTPIPGETQSRLSKMPPEAGSAAGQMELRMQNGGVVIVFPGLGGTGVAYASIDLVCGSKTYTVGTGNSHGECKSGGNGNNAICDDGHGNGAEVTCSSGCGSSSGSGSCSAKAQ
jgi:hypothetical protein